ncbi:MAG: sigma-54-dependent Fis family transcriptional regulator [Candidatus Marinimicrobia bacterium]|nr:sigma-54-dependent Fis family transcriptional regulator [Candidatus Neomarinimicrobiota bacterium]
MSSPLREFLLLSPHRRVDPQPEKTLTQHLKQYGQITKTSDWVSLFNYASINRYSAIFLSCTDFADESKMWAKDLRRLHPHQSIILYSANADFDTGIVNENSRLFGILRIDHIESSLADHMAQLDKYLQFSLSLMSKSAKKLLRPGGFGEFVGNSLPILDVYKQLTRVASTEYTVLIQGESGSGKELVARTIHRLSERRGKAFISINCAAIPENLLESELFGYEKGAFTGAAQDKVGKFELADGGTLFLDEIGDMPLELQVKMLRVLEDGMIQPLGSVKERKVNIRLVTATHKNLPEQITLGLFREDLHYRLNVIPLKVPPLRSRSCDLPLLVLHFLEKLLRGEDQTIRRIAWDLIDSLDGLSLKGNVRELENLLTRSVFQTDGSLLDSTSLNISESAAKIDSQINTQIDPDIILPLWQIEKTALKRSLDLLDGNISQAALQLEISRTAIYRKIKKYGLSLSEGSSGEGEENA